MAEENNKQRLENLERLIRRENCIESIGLPASIAAFIGGTAMTIWYSRNQFQQDHESIMPYISVAVGVLGTILAFIGIIKSTTDIEKSIRKRYEPIERQLREEMLNTQISSEGFVSSVRRRISMGSSLTVSCLTPTCLDDNQNSKEKMFFYTYTGRDDIQAGKCIKFDYIPLTARRIYPKLFDREFFGGFDSKEDFERAMRCEGIIIDLRYLP